MIGFTCCSTMGGHQVILHGSLMVAGGIARMAIHGLLGSSLKYGLDAQEEQFVRGVVPGQSGWGEDPVRAFSTMARK